MSRVASESAVRTLRRETLGFVFLLAISPCALLAQDSRPGNVWAVDTLWSIPGDGSQGVLLSGLQARDLAPSRAGGALLLDRLGRRVYHIERGGAVTDSMFQEGPGPGELVRPVSLTTDADGNPAVFDRGKGHLERVSFTSGSALPALSVGGVNVVGEGVRWVGDRGVYKTLEILADGQSRYALQRSNGAASPERLGAAPAFSTVTVDYPSCHRSLTVTPHFTHRIPFAVGSSGRIALAAGPEYRVTVIDVEGSTREFRRDVEPKPVTNRLALRELEGYRIGSCPVPAREALSGRGYADVFPTIRAVSVTPTDEVWVERYTLSGEPSVHDVFAPSGDYIGAVEGLPPIAVWVGEDSYLTVSEDDLGVPSLTRVRVVRD